MSLLTAALIVLVIATLYILKQLRTRRIMADVAFEHRWRELLVTVALDEAACSTYPVVTTQADRWRLLKLWIRMQMMLQGRARTRLRNMGVDLGMHEIAMQYFKSKRRSEQVLSVLCLGFLKEQQSWAVLEHLLDDPSHSISLHAAWALLELDGERAASLALDVLVQRPAGDMTQTSALFKPFAAQLLKAWQHRIEPMCHTNQRLKNQSDIIQMLRLAIALEMPVPDAWLLSLFDQETSTEEAVSILKLLHQPSSLSFIEQLSQHPDWEVRTQVARAIGRLGTKAQWPVLQRLITDPQWWVRYRAAQAMTQCSSMSAQELRILASQWTDRFAKDMLNQVLAQRWNHYVD
jgi:hypothetical protein